MDLLGKLFGRPMRGGANETYCSKGCWEKGGRYVYSLGRQGVSGICGFCQKQASVHDSIAIPHEGKTLFVCTDCLPEWRKYLTKYSKCFMCQKKIDPRKLPVSS